MARSRWVFALAVAGIGMAASAFAEKAQADIEAWQPAAKAAGDAVAKAGHAKASLVAPESQAPRCGRAVVLRASPRHCPERRG